MSIGKRIAEERKRMGLSQTAFANLVGVSLSSQRRYEKGDSDPDSAYLTASSKAGVDIAYLLTGEKEGGQRAASQGYVHVIRFLQGYLELAKGPISIEFDEAAQASYDGTRLYWENPDKNLEASERADDKLRAVIQKSPVLLLREWQLEEIIEKVEFALEAKGLKLEPATKARVILALYREQKKTGKNADFSSVDRLIQSGGF